VKSPPLLRKMPVYPVKEIFSQVEQAVTLSKPVTKLEFAACKNIDLLIATSVSVLDGMDVC